MKGRYITYSADERAFVRELGQVPRVILHAEFVAMFGRHDVTLEHINALAKRMKLGVRPFWTPAEDAVLREHFPHMPTKRVAEMLGRTSPSCSQRAKKLGLEKSAAYLASEEAGRMRKGDTRGASTRFKPGQTPMNKGVVRGRGWAPGRMREGQFRQGQSGWNWKPIGAERVVDGYLYRKVSDHRKVVHTKNWKPVHVLNWEAQHGPLPEGYALKCLDGNRLNVAPENWDAVPRAILPRLNGGPRGRRLAYDEAPAELKPIVLTTAKLTYAMNKRSQERAA